MKLRSVLVITIKLNDPMSDVGRCFWTFASRFRLRPTMVWSSQNRSSRSAVAPGIHSPVEGSFGLHTRMPFVDTVGVPGSDRASSSVFWVISPAGGIRPAEWRRAPAALSLGEREEISRGLSTRHSLRAIARTVGRSPSTISRKVRRNGGPEHHRPLRSDEAAWDRARRPKLCKLACSPSLARTVSVKLQLNWSPSRSLDG